MLLQTIFEIQRSNNISSPGRDRSMRRPLQDLHVKENISKSGGFDVAYRAETIISWTV